MVFCLASKQAEVINSAQRYPPFTQILDAYKDLGRAF